MPAGKMLMVSKAQDQFYHFFFVLTVKKGQERGGKSQDYLVSCPTVNF